MTPSGISSSRSNGAVAMKASNSASRPCQIRADAGGCRLPVLQWRRRKRGAFAAGRGTTARVNSSASKMASHREPFGWRRHVTTRSDGKVGARPLTPPPSRRRRSRRRSPAEVPGLRGRPRSPPTVRPRDSRGRQDRCATGAHRAASPACAIRATASTGSCRPRAGAHSGTRTPGATRGTRECASCAYSSSPQCALASAT